MTAYRVSFFNELTNSSGKLVKVCQRSVDIRVARTRDRAIEAAKKRFARLEHVDQWWLHARLVEIEDVADAIDPMSWEQARTAAGHPRRGGRSKLKT